MACDYKYGNITLSEPQYSLLKGKVAKGKIETDASLERGNYNISYQDLIDKIRREIREKTPSFIDGVYVNVLQNKKFEEYIKISSVDFISKIIGSENIQVLSEDEFVSRFGVAEGLVEASTGKIYLNPAMFTTTTAFHELGHLVLENSKIKNLKAYKNLKERLLADPNYSTSLSSLNEIGYSDDLAADEMLARLLGSQASNLFEASFNEVVLDERKSLIHEFKNLLKNAVSDENANVESILNTFLLDSLASPLIPQQIAQFIKYDLYSKQGKASINTFQDFTSLLSGNASVNKNYQQTVANLRASTTNEKALYKGNTVNVSKDRDINEIIEEIRSIDDDIISSEIENIRKIIKTGKITRKKVKTKEGDAIIEEELQDLSVEDYKKFSNVFPSFSTEDELFVATEDELQNLLEDSELAKALSSSDILIRRRASTYYRENKVSSTYLNPELGYIYDIVVLTSGNLHYKNEKQLFSNILKNNLSYSFDINLTNSNADIASLRAALLASAIKTKTENASIGQMSVLSTNRSSIGNSVKNYLSVLPNTLLQNLKSIPKIEEIKALMPPVLINYLESSEFQNLNSNDLTTDYLHTLLAHYNSYEQITNNEEPNVYSVVHLGKTANKYLTQNVVNNTTTFSEDLRKAITWRLHQLDKQLSSETSKAENQEYVMLAKALYELENGKNQYWNSIKDIDQVSGSIDPSLETRNPYFSWVISHYEQASTLMKNDWEEDMNNFIDATNSYKKKYDNLIGFDNLKDSLTTELTRNESAYYSRLTKKDNVLDKKGKLIEVNTMTLLRPGDKEYDNLFDFEKDYIEVLNNYNKNLIRLLLEYQIKNENTTAKPVDIETRIFNWFENKYVDGMLPVTNTSIAGSLFTDKEFLSNQLSSIWTAVKNRNLENEGKIKEYEKIADMLLPQFSKDKFGSISRMRFLGIDMNNEGNFVLEKDTSPEYDLKKSYAFFSLNARKKMALQDVVGTWKIASALLKNNELTYDVSQQNFKEQMDSVMKALLFDERYKDSDSTIAQAFNRGARVINTVVTALQLGFNPKTAVSNFVVNAIGMFEASIADHKNTDRFQKSELEEAARIVFTDGKKAEKIAMWMKLFRSDEYDMITRSVWQGNKNKLLTADAHMAGDAFGDKLNRLIAITAQLIKDGVWDALSVEGNKVMYDETKDKRFYHGGKLTEKGAILRNFYIQNRIKQNYQTATDKLTAPYDTNFLTRINIIVDRVLGNISDVNMSAVNTNAFAQLFTRFRSYLFSKVQKGFSKPKYNNAYLQYEVKDDKVFSLPLYQVGMLHSFIKYIHLLHYYNYKFNKAGAELREEDINNIRKVVIGGLMSGSVIIAAIVLFRAFESEEDEKDRLKKDLIERIYESVINDTFLPNFIAGTTSSLLKNPFVTISIGMKYLEAMGQLFYDWDTGIERLETRIGALRFAREAYEATMSDEEKKEQKKEKKKKRRDKRKEREALTEEEKEFTQDLKDAFGL